MGLTSKAAGCGRRARGSADSTGQPERAARPSPASQPAGLRRVAVVVDGSADSASMLQLGRQRGVTT